MSDIRVNVEKIRKENSDFRNATGKFGKYDKSYIEGILSAVEKMHSDYLNELKRTLVNMEDTVAPQLIKHAKEYSKAVKEATDAFADADKTVSDVFEQ